MSDMPDIVYSAVCEDLFYEYRHVILPVAVFENVPKNRLMTEAEWRGAGINLEPGWENFLLHRPEPFYILFRRPLPGLYALRRLAAA